jgi:hypothetical protein
MSAGETPTSFSAGSEGVAGSQALLFAPSVLRHEGQTKHSPKSLDTLWVQGQQMLAEVISERGRIACRVGCRRGCGSTGRR